MRAFVLVLTVAFASCSSPELAHLPPYSPSDAGPGFTPGIAETGLITPTIDTRLPNIDTKTDSATLKRDTAVDLVLPDLSPGLGSACDLLLQNCPSKANACYPITGKGEARCQPAGSVGEGGSCYLGSDTPQCDQGLTCIQDIMQGGVCLVLCDVFDSITDCGIGSLCQPLPFFTRVGYCMPG